MRPIPSAGPWITEKEIKYVTDACENGWYGQWDGYLKRFEAKIAEVTDCKYAIATSSCTGALHIAMLAAGIGPGDEVIVPEVTWVASVTCVNYVGATPVFVDVEPDTWCMDPKALSHAITDKTKAIIPVHMYGHPADMTSINQIAAHHGIKVIEDAAPALGSRYEDRPAGGLSLAGTFSFQGAKPLVMGEGGALVTNDKDFYDRAYYYWDHCRDTSQVLYNTDIGVKYKLSNIQAALGLAQLERIDEIIEKRRKIFFWYQERLAGIQGLRLNSERKNVFNNFYVPTVILEKDFGLSRDVACKHLDDHQIGNRPFFRTISKLPMFEPAKTPVADHLAAQGINLPCASVMTEDQVDYTAKTLRKILKVEK